MANSRPNDVKLKMYVLHQKYLNMFSFAGNGISIHEKENI